MPKVYARVSALVGGFFMGGIYLFTHPGCFKSFEAKISFNAGFIFGEFPFSGGEEEGCGLRGEELGVFACGDGEVFGF